MKISKTSFKFSAFPFNIGYHEKKFKDIPERLPFIIYFNERLGLISQKVSDEARIALNKYYLLGGYGSTPLGEGSFGDRRANWTLDVIKKSLGGEEGSFEGLSFLEIGCASGYLLHLIKRQGAKKVWGLEPGEKGVKAAREYGLKIVNDFFPSKKIGRKFDYILSHCVLEHMENPEKSLKEMVQLSTPEGIVFIAVPDCGEKMSVGDISILTHQHVNYFTKNSLSNLMRKIGLVKVTVVKSKKIAMLYGWGKKSRDENASIVTDRNKDMRVLQNYVKGLNKNIREIQRLVDKYESQNKTIGFYGDCGILKGSIRFKKEPRVFDGDSSKTGKYMVCSQNTFEPKENLISKPLDILFITPIDYDLEIRSDLKIIGFDDKMTKIISLKGIYEKISGIKYTSGSRPSR